MTIQLHSKQGLSNVLKIPDTGYWAISVLMEYRGLKRGTGGWSRGSRGYKKGKKGGTGKGGTCRHCLLATRRRADTKNTVFTESVAVRAEAYAHFIMELSYITAKHEMSKREKKKRQNHMS